MEVISNIALISINETMIAQLVSFLIFLFVMNRLMFRPLRGTMRDRENYMEKIQLDITDAGNSLDAATRQLETREEEVRSGALAIKSELEAKGDEIAQEIFKVARDEIATIEKRTSREMEAKIAEARKTFNAEAEALTIRIMEKILDRRLAR
jgi:F-type H+-transporting ATPase subunit b